MTCSQCFETITRIRILQFEKETDLSVVHILQKYFKFSVCGCMRDLTVCSFIKDAVSWRQYNEGTLVYSDARMIDIQRNVE